MTYLGQNIKKLGFGLMRLPMMWILSRPSRWSISSFLRVSPTLTPLTAI